MCTGRGRSVAHRANAIYWWNPYLPGTIQQRTVARLTKASSQYFKIADAGAGDPFNFQTGGVSSTWTSCFWVRFNSISNNDGLLNKTQFDATLNNGVWLLRLGGTLGANLEFWAWKGATSSGAAVVSVPASVTTGKWYFVMLVYDGTQHGTDPNVLTIYLNGTKLTTPAGSSLPQLLQNPATGNTPFYVGSNLAATYSDFSMNGLTFWSRALSSTEAATVYNLSAGVGPNDTAAAQYSVWGVNNNLLSYWVMNEASGPRTDATGNGHTLTEQNGPIGSEIWAPTWVDALLSKTATSVFPTNSGSVGGQDRNSEALYSATVRGGKPGLKFPALSQMYVGNLPALFNSLGSGYIIANLVLDSPSTSESLSIMFSDDQDNTKLRYLGFNMLGTNDAPHANDGGNGVNPFTLRVRNDSGSGDISSLDGPESTGKIPAGNKGITPSTNHTLAIANVGSGLGAPAYRILIDGASQAVTVNDGGSGAFSNFWTSGLGNCTALTFNGLARLGDNTSGIWDISQNGFGITLGHVLIGGPYPGDAAFNALLSAIAAQ
ncbi:MAG TPA: LamG domain-containing protein [Pirellulales bacterium]